MTTTVVALGLVAGICAGARAAATVALSTLTARPTPPSDVGPTASGPAPADPAGRPGQPRPTVVVTRAQVHAAQALVRRDTARGRAPRPEVLAIACARRVRR